jgi:hypothetical protein
LARGTSTRRSLLQTGVAVTAVLAYFGARGLTEGDPDTALRNARRVEAAERFLHLDREASLQGLVVGDQALTRLLNWIYIFGHWPVIALTLGWLLTRRHEVYTRVRNALLLSGAAGVVIFAAFPVAPPRLAHLGLVDTVTQQSDAYRLMQPTAFTNQYAAMPSLHVGWNLLMTLAILAATHRTWVRVLAEALTLSMDATVVLTANHYLLDAIMGAGLAGLSWYIAGRMQAHQSRAAAGPNPMPAPVRLAHRPPRPAPASHTASHAASLRKAG